MTNKDLQKVKEELLNDTHEDNKSVEITIDDNPGEPEIAFASRYAFVELESDNSIDYYGKVIVNNLTV